MLDSIPPSCNSWCGAVHVFLRFERWPFTPWTGEAGELAGSWPGWYLGSASSQSGFSLCDAGEEPRLSDIICCIYTSEFVFKKEKEKDLNTQRKLE